MSTSMSAAFVLAAAFGVAVSDVDKIVRMRAAHRV
jgi:hypothetical protein